jgi:hypothetical protein
LLFELCAQTTDRANLLTETTYSDGKRRSVSNEYDADRSEYRIYPDGRIELKP